jgi:hypothetical protein
MCVKGNLCKGKECILRWPNAYFVGPLLNKYENRGVTAYRAPEVVTAALAVELASTVVDVGGAVAVHPRLRNKTSGTSIAGVEGNRLENSEHFVV